ncbi:type II toxin-antitoxin system VapB family antitoxin [Chelatococcus reniformis]|uniref:Antitoxin VapB n=1 Tax=Chelatococcus reniformis TaxID=1494448 RepID=A0A916U5Z9_9HYPH|nr:type II toxin-antitoxin system VapB family antitoxin [Chelatococcus reniformis]GGC61974.1 hypothetical protein GCM10010994_20740 [Chelatococcus reniformis]
MALHINSATTERLALEVAELTGESVGEAVRKSLETRLVQARAAHNARVAAKMAQLRHMQDNDRRPGPLGIFTERDLDADRSTL